MSTEADLSQFNQKDFYTIGEAAEILRLSKTTIGRYLRTGTLRGVNLGRKWRIPAAEIERLKAAGPEHERGEPLHDKERL